MTTPRWQDWSDTPEFKRVVKDAVDEMDAYASRALPHADLAEIAEAVIRPAVAAYRRQLRTQIQAHYQPIGCGLRIGMPGRETTCGDRGICSACFDRRNERDAVLGLLGGDE